MTGVQMRSREARGLRPAAVAVEVGVGDAAVAAEAAFLVGGFAAAVLLGEVAAELVLDVGVGVIPAVAGKFRRFKAALVREPPAVLVVALGAFVFGLLREPLVLLVGHVVPPCSPPGSTGGTEHVASDVPGTAT
jgi:hypothetical protein